jgi:glycosyltransferase involved in cell wall biosynthesis
MRIALVAPPIESVPPRFYGGTERVVANLAEALVAKGHEVTVFASGDSKVQARLVPVCRQALRLAPSCSDPLPHLILAIERVLQHLDEFDLVHFHTDFCHFPAFRRVATPWLGTLHGRLDLIDLVPLYREFADVPLVSISDAQRRPMPWLDWRGTVYHGLPANSLVLRPATGSYLAFLGWICPEKRPDRAIEIAKRAGIPLKIAAKVDPVDRSYFETVVRPLLDSELVEFVGEIGEAEKAAFLGDALALLFPIDWPEPFGLVLVEAMACGTPTVAYRAGSVPEIIEQGRSGFVVEDLAGAVAAVHVADRLERREVRRAFEQRFTAERMADDYLRIYARLTAERDRVDGDAAPWGAVRPAGPVGGVRVSAGRRGTGP